MLPSSMVGERAGICTLSALTPAGQTENEKKIHKNHIQNLPTVGSTSARLCECQNKLSNPPMSSNVWLQHGLVVVVVQHVQLSSRGQEETEDSWQVTYVIVILADTAPEAAEALVLSLQSKPPTVTSCCHSDGQRSTGLQHWVSRLPEENLICYSTRSTVIVL